MLQRFLTSQTLILGACVLLVLYLSGVPIVMLIFGSLRNAPVGDPGAAFTIENYTKVYFDSEFYWLFWNSLRFAFGTSLFSFTIGTYFAWLSERTNTPFKKIFIVMALVPFLVPGILETIAWIFLLSPRIGVINRTLMTLLGLESAPFNIYSMWGMIWVEGLSFYPIVFLLMSAALRSMDPSLEEASMVAGSSAWTTLRRVTLPIMRPAILSVFLIIFIRAIEAFEVPALIGIPAKVPVFTSKIFLAIHQFPSDFGLAGTYAVSVMLLSIGGILLYQKATQRGERYATITGKGYRPGELDLGRWRYVTFASAMLIFFVAVILPISILLWSSFIPYYGVPSRALFEKLTLDNYRHVLNYPVARIAFKNSFILSIGAATVTMLLTSVIAWITVRTRMRGRGILESITFIPITIPGIVLGVSLIWVYLTLPKFVPFMNIYGTLWILLIAYVTKYLPYGIRAASGTMIQINKELEEASNVCGASWFRTFWRVIIPLLMPGFMAGWIYISVVALRELSTSILLYSQNSTVLSIMAFDLWESGQFTNVAALGVLMVLLMITLVTVARLLGAKLGVVTR
jgi:iron(III) transport system permease protein